MNKYNNPLIHTHPQCGMDRGSLNSLIPNQFGDTSFNIVRVVYDNLMLLKLVYENIPTIQLSSQLLPQLNVLVQNQGYIQELVTNLNKLIQLHDNLPQVQELAPKLNDFTKEFTKLNNYIGSQDIKIEELQQYHLELKNQYMVLISEAEKALNTGSRSILVQFSKEANTVLCNLKKVKADIDKNLETVNTYLPQLVDLANNLPKLKQDLAGLKASDLTIKHLFEQTEFSRKEALNAIKESEKLGNNERVNKKRVNSKIDDLNLFKVLNERNLELAHKNTETMFK